jgi:hypothetical protein
VTGAAMGRALREERDRERHAKQPRPLLGLTLWRPWSALIAAGIKRIENRPWHPEPRLQRGEWFAVHAGKKYDDTCSAMAAKLGTPLSWFTKDKLDESAIVCVARYDGYVTSSEDGWFFGPFGWLLGEVVAFQPIPCKGAQGLWNVPAATADLVRAAYANARRAA